MFAAIPDAIITAGLVGCGISLIVATAMQKWQPKAFFLLALRFAIGWQFLFEGLYKINSEWTGPSETNKVFTSEPYFKASPTALGAMMRRQFDDPDAAIRERVTVTVIPRDQFLKLTPKEQADLCPPAVAKQLDEMAAAGEVVEQGLAVADHEAAHRLGKEEDIIREGKVANLRRANAAKTAATQVEAAKIAYARWVFGVDGRDVKVKHVHSDVTLTAPQRLRLIENAREQLREAEAREAAGVGRGNGVELKRTSDLRMEVNSMEAELARDAKAFVSELKKDLAGKEVPEPAVESRGKALDRVTMWFITIVGGCILFGFLTRISCVLAAGFLFVTYLTYPPFPWYALPPMTEGNPLFVNKNLIEMLSLLVLACYPTGRWLGLDAILALAIPYYRNRNSDLTKGS